MNSNSFSQENNQMSLSLSRVDQRDVRFRGRKIKLKSNPIFKYNYFIACYNTHYNKVNGISLPKIPRNRFYYTIFPILRVRYLVISFALNFIPYFNII